mmetsp:Transcript_49259/g.111764  ORF Transcript_49259/g.111764 Transcript_49259/m.111764 type:complete len:566 (-) Transcript_49259:236-1933(-)
MPLNWPWKLPIDDIKEYFGEQIAFYFAFLAHVTTWLLPLSALALVFQIASFVFFYGNKDGSMPLEALFAIVSSTTLAVAVDAWICKQSELGHLWESLEEAHEVPARPGFQGIVSKNPKTGKLELDFPQRLRQPRQRSSLIVTFFCFAVLFAALISIFAFRATLRRSHTSGFISLLPSAINSVQISLFSIAYRMIAERLTDYENHKTVDEHNGSLFQKLTAFYFVNNYSSLFYQAFFRAQIEGCGGELGSSVDTDYCGRGLAILVAMVFFVNDFGIRIMRSLVMPRIMSMYKKRQAAKDTSINHEAMGGIEKQFFYLADYEPTSNLIRDYIELFAQWGYLTLFGSACPIVIFMAFITNFIETRTDGFKLLHEYRRVVPSRVSGIGEPLNIYIKILYLSLPVNAGLAVFTYGLAKQLPSILVFVGILLTLVAFSAMSSEAYPEMPNKTEVQIGRQKMVYQCAVEKKPFQNKIDLDPSMLGKSIREIKEAQLQSHLPTVSYNELGDTYHIVKIQRRSWAVKNPHLVCSCGNHFVQDAVFCRKCGAKRPAPIAGEQGGLRKSQNPIYQG